MRRAIPHLKWVREQTRACALSKQRLDESGEDRDSAARRKGGAAHAQASPNLRRCWTTQERAARPAARHSYGAMYGE